MDANLHNAYVEVLLDNFMSVIKQNVMFQAQLEVLNKNSSDTEQLKRQLNDVINRNIELQNAVNSLNGENTSLKNFPNKEKDRLQTALNDAMKKNKELKQENDKLNKYIDELKSQSE